MELADSALHAPMASFEGQEFYPDIPTKAAVLCSHVAKNHPLPDGNKRVALVCTIEFCRRNGYRWSLPPGDEDGKATATLVWSVAAEELTEDSLKRLAAWIAERIAPPT